MGKYESCTPSASVPSASSASESPAPRSINPALTALASSKEHQQEQIGKAGRKRWMGIRPRVRGVAMNACDHPHGGGRGKSKGNKHPRSVFGWLTKGKRTRRPRDKDGNKMYVRVVSGFVMVLICCAQGGYGTIKRTSEQELVGVTLLSYVDSLVHLASYAYIDLSYKTLRSCEIDTLQELLIPKLPASTSRTLHKRPERAYGRFIRMSLRRVNLTRKAFMSACPLAMPGATHLVRRHFPILDRRMWLVVAQLEVHASHYATD